MNELISAWMNKWRNGLNGQMNGWKTEGGMNEEDSSTYGSGSVWEDGEDEYRVQRHPPALPALLLHHKLILIT